MYAAADSAALEDIVGVVRRETIPASSSGSRPVPTGPGTTSGGRWRRKWRRRVTRVSPPSCAKGCSCPTARRRGVAGPSGPVPPPAVPQGAGRAGGRGRRRRAQRTTALDLDEDTAHVTTDHGVIRAQHVVVATHSPVFDRGPISLRIMARRSYVIAAPLPDPLTGMYISTDEDYRSVRTQPVDGRRWTLFGGEPHRTGEGGDERDRYVRLQSWADEEFSLRPEYYEWSTQDIWTVDDLPFIGRYREGERPDLGGHRLPRLGHDAQHGGGARHQRRHPPQGQRVGFALRPVEPPLAQGSRGVVQPGRREHQGAHRGQDERRPGLYAHGVRHQVERRRAHVGLPLPRLPLHRDRGGAARAGDPDAGVAAVRRRLLRAAGAAQEGPPDRS